MIDLLFDLLFGLLRYVVDRKGWLWGGALVLVVVGLGYIFWPREVQYPKDPMLPAYRGTTMYLVNATTREMPKFPKDVHGIAGAYIPVVSYKDFPLLTKKLRQEFRAAERDGLFHSIVLGSRAVRSLDQPLLRASKGLHPAKQANLQVVIVTPSTVSAETEQTLRERGVLVQRIGLQ